MWHPTKRVLWSENALGVIAFPPETAYINSLVDMAAHKLQNLGVIAVPNRHPAMQRVRDAAQQLVSCEDKK
jgi:hypothetical protein